jgi:hypothetical protein
VSTDTQRRRCVNRRRSTGLRASAVDLGAPPVVDNLPDGIPVTLRELETIEPYLADLIDHVLNEAVDEGGIASSAA